MKFVALRLETLLATMREDRGSSLRSKWSKSCDRRSAKDQFVPELEHRALDVGIVVIRLVDALGI